MEKIKIAIQKSGRLFDKSIELLRDSGIKLQNGSGKLLSVAEDFPLDILFLRDDDIPEYVEAARNYGLQGLIFRNAKDVWELLKENSI